MRKAVDGYLLCLQEERFYDAHEVLEALWFPRRFEKNDEMLLLKGFINASVSFELMKRGRPEPSARAWKTYVKYLPLIEKVPQEQQRCFERLVEAVEITKKRSEVNV